MRRKTQWLNVFPTPGTASPISIPCGYFTSIGLSIVVVELKLTAIQRPRHVVFLDKVCMDRN